MLKRQFTTFSSSCSSSSGSGGYGWNGFNRSNGFNKKRTQADDSAAKLKELLEEMMAHDTHTEELDVDEGLLNVKLLTHQRLALAWMVHCEERQECHGGFLADDQGLGKTVTAMSLVLKSGARKPSEPVAEVVDVGKTAEEHVTAPLPEAEQAVNGKEDDNQGDKKTLEGGTLIVCPTSVMKQWAKEIAFRVKKDVLSVCVYHGARRKVIYAAEDLAKYDVVLTTYPLLTQEVPEAPLDGPGCKFINVRSKTGEVPILTKTKDGPLARISWNRVVLDEAQYMKNPKTQVARACFNLRAEKRWCLSGTPIQNCVDDLFSYFRFLKYAPLDKYGVFDLQVKSAIKKNHVYGYKKLHALLKGIMLRRNKNTIMIDGKPIIVLPSKIVESVKWEFTKEERDFYNTLEARSKTEYEEYKEEGTLNKNYIKLLVCMLRLRQACDHQSLINREELQGDDQEDEGLSDPRKLTASKRYELQQKLEDTSEECSLCKDVPEDVVIAFCGHVFCKQCALEKMVTEVTSSGEDDGYDEDNGKGCPREDCMQDLKEIYSLASLKKCSSKKRKLSSTSSRSKKVEHEVRSSSKINALLKLLRDIEKNRPGEKTLVFSQWTGMLDLVGPHLKKSGIQFRMLDGRMLVQARDAAVTDFNTNPDIEVMLMSLKAASVGLNMVAACNVVLLDPWWNPTTEEQAIDRAHRMGQTRTVRVTKLSIKDTIEDKIMQLQQTKREMVNSAFGEEGGNNKNSRNKLSAADLQSLFS